VAKAHLNRVISRKKFREFCESHPGHQNAMTVLNAWYKVARRARWKKFNDIRATFGSVDQVEKFLVFNVGGNKYRIIVDIKYEYKKIYIRHVLPHSEYDKGTWKKRPVT
jgi:mRNA interferase HigB